MSDLVDKLQHYAGAATELQRLRDRVAELEELLGANLKLPPERLGGISPSAAKVLGVLMQREYVTRTTVAFVLRGDDDVGEKYADVYIFKVRHFLKRHDVVLHNRWSVGWYIKADDKAKLRPILEGRP